MKLRDWKIELNIGHPKTDQGQPWASPDLQVGESKG